MITENQNVEWKENWRDEYIKLAAHPSKPNNPDVANAFFRAGMIESWGRGIEKIINLCVSSGLPKPEFNTNFGGLQIEFTLTQEKKVRKKTSVKTSVKMSVKIIQLLVLNSDITIPEMAEQIGISERSIERNLRNLQKSNKIVRIGPDKGGYWKVIETK